GNTPEIPSPTPAGSLKHLRVNQAGAAYELADPPVGLPSFAGAGRALITNTQNNGAAWTPVASLVETGLPTRTGHGGQYLALNANATAIDWAAPLPDLEDNAGKSLYVNAAEDGTEWDDPRAPAFAAGWVKLFEGNTDGVAGTASISFTITDDSTTAEGFLEAQRDTAGMGPYRQFLFQVAWNIGTGSDESLIQTQAMLPGVPLGGSVAQANQPISYLGNLPGLQANCAISLTASRSEVTLTGQGGCQPDWGNRGNQNVNLFWKLWGMR
ncbi:MAG: hypothetical protein OXG39_07680, partial [Chloroflexi bacterium]|nr:hypothetical protein [Chloroflexota bacterium]